MEIAALLLVVLSLYAVAVSLERGVEGVKSVDSFYVLVGSDLENNIKFYERGYEEAIVKVETYLALCSLEGRLNADEIFVLYHVESHNTTQLVHPIRSFCDHRECANDKKCRNL